VGTIAKAISRLRPDKAMGPDELSAKLLIEVQNEIAYPLLLLFKKSLSESSIPQDWKQANVTPILKKGSRNSVENYRPGVEFYLYPTVSTALVHSVKPKLTE